MNTNQVLTIGVTLLIAVPLSYNFGQSKGRENAFGAVRMVQSDLSDGCKKQVQNLWDNELAIQVDVDANKIYMER